MLLFLLSDKQLLLPGVPLCGHPELVTRGLVDLATLPSMRSVLLGLGAMFGLVHIMSSARDHLVEGVSRALV